MNKLFWLDDRQMANMEPLLPKHVRGKRRVDDRRVVSGIIQVMRSGCRWSEVPEAYGRSETLFNRFIRWSLTSTWDEIFAALAAMRGSPAEALLDSSRIEVHRSASAGRG